LQMADEGDGATSGAGAPLATPATSPTSGGTSGGTGFGAVKVGGGTGASANPQMAPGSQTVNPAAAGTSCVSPGTPQCEPEPQPWAPSK
jgi:hypothetical protein